MSSENTPTQKRTTDEIKTLLELPFRAAEITWRVLGDGEKTEGEARIIPYAYRAAYMRRLDILFGPGGWTQSFSMTTVSNIQRSKKVNKAYAMITTGKILVTSTITIEGFGTRSSTGEGWADDENGTTRAQAQAFRRACAEFGLGRYLRELEGWSCKVPVNAKGYFKRPHFSVLPDSAIHPSELAEAQEARSRHCEIIAEASCTSDGCSDSQRQSTYPRRSIVGAGCDPRRRQQRMFLVLRRPHMPLNKRRVPTQSKPSSRCCEPRK